MKIVLFGATGHIGGAILGEALARGHEVVAIVREASRLAVRDPKLAVVVGDVTRPESFAAALRGADAVIASLSARREQDYERFADNAHLLIDALTTSGIKRLLWVGGAGSLETAPGVRVIDDPNFPQAWRAEAVAQVQALDVFRGSQTKLDWTYVSPAALIEDGERTGRYRIGGEQLLADADGVSRISTQDFAAALLDRAEKNDAPNKRITVAY